MDTCCLEDQKKMDSNKVWQWRIMGGKKHSVRLEPFHHSNRIGLDFNVASNTQKQMDLQVVTNGVILEVCDFAKTVNKSKGHFITDILQNNFDLGLENEKQLTDFTAQILHKAKHLIEKPPKDKKEVFTLFDTSSKPECKTNNGLNIASAERKTGSFMVEMDDTDDHGDEYTCSQAASKEYMKTESLLEDMEGAHSDDSDDEEEIMNSVAMSAEALMEDVSLPKFPYCEGICLNLDVGSKQSLDLGLLTKGVMLELVHFSKILTASFRLIVLKVLEHNFELDLKGQQGQNQIWFRILHLLKRRDALITTGSEISMEFINDPFSFQTNSFIESKGSAQSNMELQQKPFQEVTMRRRSSLQSKQEKIALSAISERSNKGHRKGKSKDMETNTLSQHTELCTTRTAEGDHCQTGSISEFDLDSYTGNAHDKEQEEIQMENDHTCPQGESDQNSDKVTNSSRNYRNQDHKSCSLSSDVSRESEASCRKVCAPFLILTDILSSLPNVNANTKSITCQSDKRKLGGGKEQTQTRKKASKKHDLEQKELGTRNMWKLRANRVKQILSSKEFSTFHKSKKFGLQFNVGFCRKKKFRADSLFDHIFLEIATFAIAMTASQQNFIMEILEYNFDISLESEYQRNVFTCEIMKRVRQLKDCEDAVKFSKEIFELNDPIPSTSMANQSVTSVNTELPSKSRMEECDVDSGFPPHSQAEIEEHISQKCVDLYPFCKDINLKLHVNNTRRRKKLDINKLTYGAMTEVTSFAEKLCGTFEQICVDILKHNLDLESQCGDSDLARSIFARIPAVLEKINVCKAAYCVGKKKNSSINIKLDSPNNPNSDAASASPTQAAFLTQVVNCSPEMQRQHKLNMTLWHMRENHTQQILSRPHEEHCPLYSYSRCKKVGIDFNVGSGVKQNLDPKLLTNGIVVELHTFARDMLSAQKYFITEILEYNFHLEFNNELYRSVFTHKTFQQIRMNVKRKKSQMQRQFELPDTRCRPEPSFGRHLYCPKCYEVRNHKNCQDESGSGHMHHPRPQTMTDAGSADANCSAQKPAKDLSSTFSAIEEMIMDNYPLCQEIGLSLCVNKDQPKDKLDTEVLTHGTMWEVASFAKRMCGTKHKIMNDIIQHNFNTGMQGRQITTKLLYKEMQQEDALLSWLNEVFDIQRLLNKQPENVRKIKQMVTTHESELKETIKKRKLALQTQEKMAKTNPLSKGSRFSSSTKSSLTPGEKEKLDFKQINKSVCDMDQEEMAPDNYDNCPLGEFDLDSENLQIRKCSLSSDTSSLPTVNSNLNPWFASQPDERRLGRGEEQTQTLNNSNKCDMEQEEFGTENNMWKLRANRVKQILSAEEFGPFNNSKKYGLQFNVGFGPKQHFNVDSLLDSIICEIARFAIAMNSSQQNFIMEILEYNFDISLESEYQRNVFTCEIMKRVRLLKDCDDAVKFSKEIFKLHGPIPSISMANQSVASVNAELNSISRMEECDVACGFPHSQAETTEDISPKSVDLYPFCKEISLKLHVNNTQPNKKLDINKLTYGAMTEVTHFAERLCGTFEQICVDILKHNLDLDSQCGESELARSIVARIFAILEKRKLSSYLKNLKIMNSSINQCSLIWKLDPQKNPNSDAASAGSSQAAIINQEVNCSPEVEHQNELKLKLWQMRENHTQQILSIPHEEHCPLYSYSRCKKVGIDFNVGSGVKQNLDPKLLTNGIVVELHTFARDMLSAQKYFITEILEYNFHLDFNNELYRSAFAHKTVTQIRMNLKRRKSQIKTQFELPDTRCRPEPSFERRLYCPKCYQVRNHKNRQDESGSGHMHHPRPQTMTDAGSADANCSAQKPAKDPSSSFSAVEEMIMDNYPLCKEIGLSLCVNKDQPKDKLDTDVLTHWIMVELINFAKRLCGTKYKIISDVLQHNFNTGMQGRDLTTQLPFYKEMQQKDCFLTWLNEVFVIQPLPISQPRFVGKRKPTAVVHGSQWMESIKKRKMVLQKKKKKDTLPSVVKKSKKKLQCLVRRYPICTKMGLDLEVKSESGEKEKLDLKQITKSVYDMDQEEIAPDNDYTRPLGESDLDPDELTESENSGNEDNLRIPKHSLSSDTSSLPTVNSNLNPWFSSQSDERRLGGGEEQTQTLNNSPNNCDMEQEELGTENNMWKLRANRVKQILSAEEFGPFNKSKKFGLEFNIGFGPKKNFSVDSLLESIMREIARFAIAMNSSQQNFIMEILEYNFDISLESECQRNVFTCEIMKRVRQLKDCDDAVKCSKEIFELNGPIPSISMANQSMASINAELNSKSRMEKCDVACGFPPHSQAETKEHISQKCVDLYPFCKDINLKLHVNHTQPSKKLDTNKLTYGAMTEVTNFAEKLCGTFEQICVDILKHNLDLDTQCGDSDLARSIVTRIPAVLEKRHILQAIYFAGYKKKSSTNVKLDPQNNPNSDAASAGSSQAAIIEQEVNCSPEMEHQNELKLKLWQMRENHSQQILSIPHEEQCPLYSYSRCKKLGIDFNVGSGVKQNLDPKLLTNGIMVELHTFATDMLSAQKYFITEILEYNFHLDFNNELYRNVFAHKTVERVRMNLKRRKSQIKTQFELPDTRCRPEPSFERHLYCPKCYQVRNHKNRQDESGSGHMHRPRPRTMTDAGSADANCSAQKPAKDPSSSFSAIEEMIMDSYPLCKEIGLSLCVIKDQPKDKLDTDVLTHWIMVELINFAKRLCGTKYKIISDVLQHNFNTGMQGRYLITQLPFYKEMLQKDCFVTWLDEVFVIQPLPICQPRIVYHKRPTAVVHGSELMESIKKRKLALQTKGKSDTHPSVVKKSEKELQSQGCYPICTEMGLDLEVTSRSGEKEKLDLERLTRAVAGCGVLLQGNLQIKEEEYDPRYCDIKPETEKQCYPLHDDVKMESSAAEAEHVVPGEPTVPFGYTFLKSENENLQSLLAEPQGCDASPNTDGTIKTEQDTEDVNYLVPVEAAGCLGYSMVTIGQCDESTLIKEEQDNVPIDSHSSGVHKKEVGI